MNDDTKDSGLPTRAIHEAYLDMQRAMKQYRRAKDRRDDVEVTRAHGEFQESVITLYELLRQYLRDSDTLSKYWEGRPPSYNGGNQPPDPLDGDGVLHVQNRTDTVDIDRDKIDELESLKDWHDALGLNGNVRLTGVVVGEQPIVQYHAYQLGLQQLDNWETGYETATESMSGFFADKQTTHQRQVRVDIPRLKRAARELAAAAKDMGFLSDVETPTNDDPLPV